MEWPKRAQTVNWESGVLTLDGEKQFEVPELTAEIMERVGGGWRIDGVQERLDGWQRTGL